MSSDRNVLEKVFKYFFILGLVVMPLIYWPKAVLAYEIPRVFFVQRWIEILIVLGLGEIWTNKQSRQQNIDAWLAGLIGGFLLIIVITSFLGVDWSKSFFGNYYRGDGLLTFGHLIGFWLILVLIWRKEWQNLLIKAVVLGCGLVSGWAVFEGYRLNILAIEVSNWQGAIGVSFGQPNFLAGYLVVCLPFLAYLIKMNKKTWLTFFYWLMLVLQTVAIGLTKSWAGLIGVGLFIAGWLIIEKKKLRWIYIILLMLILILGVVKRQSLEFVAESRERILMKGWLGWQKRPIFGWGWANYDYAFKSIDWPFKLDADVYVDKAHSSLLEVLVTTGVVGVIVYLGMIIRTIKLLIKKRLMINKYFLFVFLLWLVHSQTNVISISEELIFWLIMAMAAV